MKISVLLLAVVLAGVLCTTASATRINTSSDACVDYAYDIQYSHGVGYQSESYTLSHAADPTLVAYNCFYFYGTWPPSQKVRVQDAVLVFSIDSLRGTALPDSGFKLWFNAYQPQATEQPGLQCIHREDDLGPVVTTDFHHGKGTYTTVGGLQAVSNQPTWFSVDVTAQIRQDLDRGFSHSTFILASEDGISGNTLYVGASEGGNGAYLSVPEPTSALCVLCGLSTMIGLAARRRRPQARR